MIDIGFYQLAERRAEAVLPQLITKALAAGHRIVVRAEDPALLARIDTALWSHAPDSFLPHGIDSDVGPDRVASQPVLLTGAPLPAGNAADCLAQVGGDLPDDLAGLTRAMFLFDADNLETARARWRVLAKGDGVRPVYWREGEGGRFEKAA
ncbi:DNA polymerase III subunit chi [Sandarakinorhabdus sp. DWP1-3-1]|uniref:DNA polymerase III subunit chi n=1 Tax=Sandarakinorhabdus sp. DWP1-3-1 TaxID=2804627 RepID=UPI003CF732AB